MNDQPRAFSTTLCRLSTAVLGTLLIILALDSVAQQPRQQLGVEIRQHSTFVSCAQPGEVTCMRPEGAVHPEGWTGLNVKNETDAWIELTIKRADSPFPRFKGGDGGVAVMLLNASRKPGETFILALLG